MNFVENIGCFCLTGWNFSWECFFRREQIDNLKKEQWYLHFRIILWHLLGIDYNTHCSLDNYKFTLETRIPFCSSPTPFCSASYKLHVCYFVEDYEALRGKKELEQMS